ncbi:MAG TPA: PKD domain-containing protein [Bacteroidia bacterium]|nr:PKD domain-containing protein [Bacteroidia bacterium]
MKTKRLYTLITALLLGLFGFVQTAGAATYYYKTAATSNPALNTNWTTSSTGVGGVTPTLAQFNAAGNTLNFFNSTAAVSGTLTASWTTLGSGTVLNIGTGARASSLDFVTFTFNRQVNVGARGTVTSSSSNPTFFGAGQFAYNAASTTILSANGVSVPSLGFSSYGNLTLSGTNASLAGKVIVAGTFNSNAVDLNGKELDLTNTIASMGTITGSSGSIYITNGANMSLSMDQTTPGTTNVLNTLSYDDAGLGNTLTLSNNLNIAPGGALIPVNGTVDASTITLTLMADQTGAYTTGAIGTLTPGIFLGNITSQIYHNPSGNKTDWTLMGSPGINSPTNIFTAWNLSFPITCSTCPNGSTVGGVTFTSITYYNEPASSYPNLMSISDALNPGIGVWVYEGNSSPGTATAGELISVSGAPVMGNVQATITGGGSGYNLLANPYPSPISWSALFNNQTNATVVGSTYLVWSPNNNGYSQCDDVGTSVPASGSYFVGDAIPTGQGFYVTSAAGGTFNFDETIKSVGSSQALLRHSGPSANKTKPTHFNIQASGNGMSAETAIKFVANATTGFESRYDGLYYPGTAGWLQVSTVANGVAYGINGMPPLNQNYSVPVRMTTGVTGTYAINGVNLQYMPAGACIILHDNYTGNNYDLRQGPHNITLTDTEKVARFVANITITSLAITTNSSQATCALSNNGYLTAVGNNAGPWNYTWKNANSTIVKTTTNKATADTLRGLGAGVYSVDVNTVGSCDNASHTYTLTLPAGTTSAFTISSPTVLVNNNVTFTDASTNANAYWWDFGDGNNSNLQNPVYAYTTPGIYDVILYSINTVCGDTVKSTQQIDVSGTTGISSVAPGQIIISRDQTGSYIKFNYSGESRVNISIYNSLGQVIFSNTGLSVSNDKIYLNLENAKGQMIFVSVTNPDKNTQVTKKLFND